MSQLSTPQKITPFLWFDNNGQEAMELYCSLFKNSKIISTSPGPDGSFFMGTFQLEGLNFHFINAGPMFKFTEAISLFVNCESQEEVDYFWNNLIANGGVESRCGWLKDKFGLSWQIIPSALGKLMGDPNRDKASRVMQAMLKMNKIIIADLEAAYNQN